MTIYRVHLERDDTGAWIARCPDVPGFHAHGRSLRQVRNRTLEALALWVDDAGTEELEFRYHLPRGWREAMRACRQARNRATDAERQAQALAAAVASELTGSAQLSMRDTAELLGLSHQRVQQLVTERRSSQDLNGVARERIERIRRLLQRRSRPPSIHEPFEASIAEPHSRTVSSPAGS